MRENGTAWWLQLDTDDPDCLTQRLTAVTVQPPTDAEARDAAIVICGHAADAAEARELLAMCGLMGVARGR